MLETALGKMNVDLGRVGDAGDAIVLKPDGEDLSAERIKLPGLVERVADPLNDGALNLTTG